MGLGVYGARLDVIDEPFATGDVEGDEEGEIFEERGGGHCNLEMRVRR